MRKLLFLFCVLAMCALPALADDKDDFKKAASVNGPSCDLIPYSTLRTNCRTASGEQNRWCTGDKELGCDKLNPADPKDRDTAKDRRDNAAECINKRNDTMGKFKDALSQLTNENTSDPETRGYIDTLKTKIQKSIDDHTGTIGQVENRRRKCDDVYNGRN
jgi:hypothetical protein